MTMIKVIPPGSYDWGERAAQLIKIASNGLRGNDLGMLIKRAGHEFADAVKNLSFDKGEVPIHLIAMGATESVGPNRNGDGFKMACLRKYHDTFMKHAKFYRNHKNKDPKKSYGIVKLSMYNEPMRRVELIVALNGTKEAAARNDGLVADDEVEKLEKGADLGCSMSCKVAYDTCSSCGNKAKNRNEYCLGSDEGGTCKYGGLKNNIGLVAEDGHHLHADNPHPLFFDISKVFRPADRTAFITGKVASSRIVSGAELAEILSVSAPTELYTESEYNPTVLSQVKIARELAGRERNYQANDFDKLASVYSDIDSLETVDNYQRSYLLKAFAEEKIALSITDWLKLTTGSSEEKLASVIDDVRQCLPTVFNELIEDPNLADLISNNPCKSNGASNLYARQLAAKYASNSSLDKLHIQERLWRAALRQSQPVVRTKTASAVSPITQQLAKQYAVYQVGFLHDIGHTNELDLTMDLIIRQNRTQ